jgi:hypothetical protein
MPVVAAARWASSRWRAQLLLYLSAYWAYSATRWIAAGEVPKAIDHAHWIVHLEQALHLSVEGPVQRALDTGAPIWLLNHLYLVAQFAVVPGALIWLYAHSPAVYRALRNTVLATWLIAVPIYALFPVAPPRLAGIGIIDTISDQSEASLLRHSRRHGRHRPRFLGGAAGSEAASTAFKRPRRPRTSCATRSRVPPFQKEA